LPVSERLCAESLSLPCFPELTDEEVAQVVAAVRAAAAALD
jgi:dTDP-4-amino-4,6-dideoxygalactose transaminase